jgi:hypothetical protein
MRAKARHNWANEGLVLAGGGACVIYAYNLSIRAGRMDERQRLGLRLIGRLLDPVPAELASSLALRNWRCLP